MLILSVNQHWTLGYYSTFWYFQIFVNQHRSLQRQSSSSDPYTHVRPVLMLKVSGNLTWYLRISQPELMLKLSGNLTWYLRISQPELMYKLSGNLTWYWRISQPDLILTPSFNQYWCTHSESTSPATESISQPYTIIHSFLIHKPSGNQSCSLHHQSTRQPVVILTPLTIQLNPTQGPPNKQFISHKLEDLQSLKEELFGLQGRYKCAPFVWSMCVCYKRHPPQTGHNKPTKKKHK
jgi:hypothetical protein